MTVIRKVEISNFRGICSLTWCPAIGVNCLIGAGDSGKSSVLDAIDLCLGARRNIQISDADFHNLDIEQPIQIAVTLGDLDVSLKNIDTYGLFLRGLDLETGEIAPEPEADLETVLTVRLKVEGDLEPQWALVSERAEAQAKNRRFEIVIER